MYSFLSHDHISIRISFIKLCLPPIQEITNQLNDAVGTGENKAPIGDPTVHNAGHPSANVGLEGVQPAAQRQDGNSENAASFGVKDPKEAGKLLANKELQKEMDLDFEEISDGELEEENKFKGKLDDSTCHGGILTLCLCSGVDIANFFQHWTLETFLY